MESEDAVSPEKLIDNLTLSEENNSQQATCNDAHNHKFGKEGMNQLSDSETREDEDFFHDCNDSFVSEVVEENHNDKADNSEIQAEPDEKDLLELEKDMSDEEKQERRNKSIKLKEEGNEQFKKGASEPSICSQETNSKDNNLQTFLLNKDYKEAEDSYAKALQVCPACCKTDRSILYSNRAAARMKQDKKDTAISDCSKALELNANYIKALLRRAELYEKTDKLDEALEDYKNLLEKDPSIHQAREACMRLPRQIEERNEKLKEEMLGKLKDLGNLVLRPFGLSTENFQVKQDSSTGSYSINFVQNPNNNNR